MSKKSARDFPNKRYIKYIRSIRSKISRSTYAFCRYSYKRIKNFEINIDFFIRLCYNTFNTRFRIQHNANHVICIGTGKNNSKGEINMKKIKRIIASVMSIVLLLVALPLIASAATTSSCGYDGIRMMSDIEMIYLTALISWTLFPVVAD